MDIKFKTATYENVEDIISLCNECFEEPLDFEYARKLFKQGEADENQIYLIGIADNKIVAHTKITIIPTMYKTMNNYAILNHVCVKPEYRRNNIATKMLYECERIANDKGCVAMELWSADFRKPAHECYKAYGFKPTNCIFFKKNVDWEVL